MCGMQCAYLSLVRLDVCICRRARLHFEAVLFGFFLPDPFTFASPCRLFPALESREAGECYKKRGTQSDLTRARAP